MTESSSSRRNADRYEIVVRRMNTFVCEDCFNEELMKHPTLGDVWTDEWYIAMSQLAKDLGWQMVTTQEKRRSFFFKEFKVIGPMCAKKR